MPINGSLPKLEYTNGGSKSDGWNEEGINRFNHQGGGKLLHIKTGLVLRPFESFYNYFIRFAVILIRYRITDS
jgi:hypothetical protein